MPGNNESIILLNSLKSLERWIEKENYKGYDPYDFLSSPVFDKNNYLFNFYFQQIGKYMPINLRKFLKIQKTYDPKALSLIAKAYLLLDNMKTDKSYIERGTKILEILLKLCNDKKYCGWGLSFPWQSRNFYLRAYEPNIVATCIGGLTFLRYYERLNVKEYLQVGIASGEYIVNRLRAFNNTDDLCFSYTPYDNSRITDANLFAGALFAKLYKYTKDEKYLDMTHKIINYTKKMILSDGRIIYGYDSSGHVINQLDYHQGFDIDLMKSISKDIQIDLSKEIELATEYYRYKMFNDKGFSIYRNNTTWPIDIHNQAQGIITFSNIPKYKNFALKIALWTIRNMQSDRGYFYTHKWPFGTNKIPYMRWGQAWMLLALSSLINNLERGAKYE